MRAVQTPAGTSPYFTCFGGGGWGGCGGGAMTGSAFGCGSSTFGGGCTTFGGNSGDLRRCPGRSVPSARLDGTGGCLATRLWSRRRTMVASCGTCGCRFTISTNTSTDERTVTTPIAARPIHERRRRLRLRGPPRSPADRLRRNRRRRRADERESSRPSAAPDLHGSVSPARRRWRRLGSDLGRNTAQQARAANGFAAPLAANVLAERASSARTASRSQMRALRSQRHQSTLLGNVPRITTMVGESQQRAVIGVNDTATRAATFGEAAA